MFMLVDVNDERDSHQRPQRPLLSGSDGGGARRVVHEGQLTEAAFMIVAAHTAAPAILLNQDLKHASADRREKTVDPCGSRHTHADASLSPLNHVEVIAVVALIDDALVRFDQHLEHAV